ncbi:E3 ubiquitin-protein ligase SIAH2-like isoform X2 [Maniola jurtina]|uniref:E3 ubiquitin-protein ligase SIAH2-like isoform X2 n=1 Tax=Maniola jurtina TaxID=191418 RepID=UPI001E68DDAE|nr:E3 ubiquitin-protein ligase SIAH2-like isoform X2 [Maniola jurtina]
MGAENSTPKNYQRENTTDKAIAEALEKQKRMYDEKYEELRRAQNRSVKVLLSELKKSTNGNQSRNNNVCQPPVTNSSALLYPNLNIISNNNAQMSTAYASPANNNAQMSTAYASPANNNAQMSTAYASPANNNAQMSTAYASPANNNAQMSTAYASPANNNIQMSTAYAISAINNAHMSTAYASPSTSDCQRPSNSMSSQVLPTAPSAPIDPAFEALSPITQSRPQTQTRPGSSGSQTRRPIALMTQADRSPSSVTAQSRNKAQPGSSRSQHLIAQTTQAVPSTSSLTVQSVNVPEPPLAKSKTRNIPRNKATPNIVKCVTCNCELGLQIYQCMNGHSSCKECKLKGNRCGLCRELITDMRNITLEATIAELKLKEPDDGERMKCPNSANGCFLIVKKDEVEGHLKECPYREMPCPLAAIFGVCTWKGKINHMGIHFKDVHPEHYEADVNKEMNLLNINVNHRIVYLVNLNTFHFLVHIEIDKDQKTICMTVQTLGTKFSASKWTYEFHVYNKREPRRKYQYIDTCSSNSESIRDIFMQKKCAVLSSEYAKTFLDNNKLSYKFYIKKNLNPKKQVK